MSEKYFIINIRAFLDKATTAYIGEDKLYKLLSTFSCPNPDVEYFLLHNSIEFTKKEQSVTYLVFSSTYLVGYYSIAIKPISIKAESLSNTAKKRLSRISTFSTETNSFTTSAYLIAQLGKNFSLPKENRISGDILLDFALDTISKAQYNLGGIVEFLECEDKDILMNFYTKNKFKLFNTRTTNSHTKSSPQTLNQLLKFI